MAAEIRILEFSLEDVLRGGATDFADGTGSVR
jgi:hypothetical protein